MVWKNIVSLWYRILSFLTKQNLRLGGALICRQVNNWFYCVQNFPKILLYFLTASKNQKAHLISEFLYTSANLLQLLNDLLLRKAANLQISVVIEFYPVLYFTNQPIQNATVSHLQTLLQVLEYTSVFTEFTANHAASKVGKWVILAIFQTAK